MSIPKILPQLIATRQIIPFVGAGFSIPSGAPSWKSIINNLIDTFITEEKRLFFKELLKNLSETDLAEILDIFNPTEYELTKYIIDQLDSPRLSVSKYHSLLIESAFDTIITTNWDKLLEICCHNNCISCRTIYRDQDVPLYQPSQHTQIIKIHGTISDSSSLVFRKSDYKIFWERRPVLYSLLLSLAATKSLLFLGYGFGDPNIIQLLEKLKHSLGNIRREHYAIVYDDNTVRMFNNLGIIAFIPEDFDPAIENYEESTLLCLGKMLSGSSNIAVNNFARSSLINNEIKALIKRGIPKQCLRMRGSLGWISNPIPLPADPIYGSYEQDLVEREMTELVNKFLEHNNNYVLKNILHVNSKHLLRSYPPRQIIRRMETVAGLLKKYCGRILIANDNLASHLNHMLFDDYSSLLGFKKQSIGGIDRVTVVRDPISVRREIEQFDFDFKYVSEYNKQDAKKLGIETESDNWQNEYILYLINKEIGYLNMIDEISEHKRIETTSNRNLSTYCNALVFALSKHADFNQFREDGITPYGVHIVRVIERLRAFCSNVDEDVLSAAALHDVVEDCNVTIDQIKSDYNQRIASIVDTITHKEGQTNGDYVTQLKNGEEEAKLIKLADRLDNIIDMVNIGKTIFGNYSINEYISYSKEIYDACKSSHNELANALITEINRAEKLLIG